VAVGAIFDGTGYGPDGTVWGGELLLGDTARYRRVGHLRPVRMPGGERAIRQPWRMACAWLQAAQGGDPNLPGRLTQNGVTPAQWEQVARLAQTGLAAPLTSSVGRLFDAVSALCGVCPVAHYEGQAAIELQASCDPHERGFYPMELSEADDGGIVIDPREMITAIATDLRVGDTPAQVATRFHSGLAEATVAACARAAHENATELVVLSGGVFANRRLLEQTADGLGRAGLRALVPRALPAGDGGISYGQAAVALAPDRTGAAR
jgi:hydrogenase maturation protein HypF